MAIVAIWMFGPRSIDADIAPHEQLTVDDTTRTYRMVIPHTLSQPAPIVFAFHGTGDSPQSMADYSRLDRCAADNGFILVYPAARKGMWGTVNIDPDHLDAHPDVRFFDQLLEQLSNQYDIDRHRIYLVGMSNGASFCQLLATIRSSDIAAIAAHSGSRPHNLGAPHQRFPIMLLVGEHDSAVPAMRTDAEQYRSDGHDVKIVVVPRLAHAWSSRHNAEMWAFLAQHATPNKP